MKVALVYDRVNKIGGAERILLALHKLFPNAPLYTSVYNKETAGWAHNFTIKTSFLQKIPFAKTHHEFFAPFMPLAFESFSFEKYDLVISVSSEAAKGIITSQKTKHIAYILTPTRYLWSGYENYFQNILLKTISLPVVWYLRVWDRQAVQRVDVVAAISKEVQKRVKKYYQRESNVVYPPVGIGAEVAYENFLGHAVRLSSSKNFVSSPRKNKNSYFLVVSRLVPYKRIDIVIEACNELNLPLKIVGTGSMENNLKKLAGPTVEFVGSLTDKQLAWYYKNCRALIFPGEEDFGITVVEAQLFGKPVIAYRSGGALETVVQGKTGEFFFPQTARALVKVLKTFNEEKYKNPDCKKQAEKFSFGEFKKNFIKVLKQEFSDIKI